MKIEGIIWLEEIEAKIASKHGVTTAEAEQMFANKPIIFFTEKGRRKGEDVYTALGQTDGGRYLTALFIYKKDKQALILSARDMATKERKRYDKK
jgi:uncharacterized DUF497 family protein